MAVIDKITPETKIEKGRPIPKRGRRRTRYPFADMRVGDSFYAPGKTAAQMSAYKGQAKRTHGFEFRAVTRAENGVEGCRVWRIE